MSQPNETTPYRAQMNSQPCTTATTSTAAAVPPTAWATAANRRSMQPPAPTINPDPLLSAAARSGPQAKSPATTKRGSRAATGGPSNPVARPKERQMMWMLQKFQKCLALAQRKVLEQLQRRISTSPTPTPTPTPTPPPPPPPPAAAPLKNAVVHLSAPPHIRAMSGKEYAAVSMMRSAAVHNPLLVSRALETVIDQQGPSRTTTTNSGATNKSSSDGKKKQGEGEDDNEEENVIVFDNEEGSSTAKKRRVMRCCSKNKSIDDMAGAAEMSLQIIMPIDPTNSSREEEETRTTRTVEGFIYHDEDDDEDEQASIISCNCHGMIFLTPADFIKHAGGIADAFNPIKRISITVTHLP